MRRENGNSLKGRKFGKLQVIGDPIKQGRRKYYLCQCDCGKVFSVRGDALITGNTKSCGCTRTITNARTGKRRVSTTRSGGRNSARNRLYHVWYGMKRRCENPQYSGYPHYGGRGIGVCEEWMDFQNFYEWAMENGYDPNAPNKRCTIDRIDVDGNYEPSNCRWADVKTQNNNRTNCVMLTYKGETHTVAEWAEKVGLRHGALLNRINNGWSIEKALTLPSDKGNWCVAERFI